MTQRAFSVRSLGTVFIIPCALCLSLAGCGESKFPVRPATGQVLCGGKPVTTGSVSFTPIGEPNVLETGKAATAALGADGKFVLTTFERFDGAIVGKHRVQYNVPEQDGSDEESEVLADPDAPGGGPQSRPRPAQARSLCVQKQEIIVEVDASGTNDFTIELSPAAR